jgi:two-component system chemotaxis response regulator CheB
MATTGLALRSRERGIHGGAGEATSLVYGMPRRAVELGGVDASLPFDRIAAEIVRVTTDVKRGGEDVPPH